MALVVSSSLRGEIKQRPWMLKDYLREDMSSCSSNGFRSFPRRQCCTAAVSNIFENEIVSRWSTKPPTSTSRSQTVSSAIQRASVAVINAIKLLPFNITADSSVNSAGDGKNRLARSFSKKLFKISFWKKKSVPAGGGGGRGEIEQWISSAGVCSEKYQPPSDLSNDKTVRNADSTATSNSNSDGTSESWSEITFTSDYLPGLRNDAVERKEKTTPLRDKEEEEVSRRGGVTAAPIERAVAKNAWLNEVSKKEQLSPISILDFPDNDEGSLSPFTLRISRLKDTQERLMKKLGRFEFLADLGQEPLNLVSTSVSSNTRKEEEKEEEEESRENIAEKKAKNLFNIMKAKMPTKSSTTTSNKFEPKDLLLDFFIENTIEKDDGTLLKEAEDWLNGNYDKSILSWKVKDEREAYIRDMEWASSDANLNMDNEVVLELGSEVLAHLIEESLQECCCS